MRASHRHIRIYTIGHSTRQMPEFLGLLTHNGIRTLVDIRSLPGSRRVPQFNRENLESVLPAAGIAYVWAKGLGGRRHSRKGFASPNDAWNSPAFRGYADYMLSEDFRAAAEELIEIAAASATAFMCAEAVYWRCHRRLLSDYLLSRGLDVQHIVSAGRLQQHSMTPFAVVSGGRLTYPAAAATMRQAGIIL